MPGTEEHPQKVLIISADIGAGHDLPALALAREFREQDPTALISVVNGLPAMGSMVTRVLRDNSAFMFRWTPWWFDFQYRLALRFAPTRWLGSRLLTSIGGRGLMRLIRSHNPDVIVSTYPGTTQVLGELRRAGKIDTPCYSSITDLAGLHFWAHPGIDMHYITHPESREEVEMIAGPGSVRAAAPPTSPAFFEPRDQLEARAALDLPTEGTVIAVSGGGWGVGDVIGAARQALSFPDATVLCLCGKNDDLLRRVSDEFADEPRLRAMGFTNQMGDVLAGADVLIHSSVGLTVLEALIRGCPVISYGFGYGHVRVSNQALKRFGLAQVACNEEELRPAIERAMAAPHVPDGSFAERSSIASLIATNVRRAAPLPTWRVRTVRAASAAATVAVAAVFAFTASISYTVVEAFGAATPITAVTTPKPQVGVMIDASASAAPKLARELADSGMRVSFAINQPVPSSAKRVASYGDEPVPQLSDSGLVSWLHTRGELHKLLTALGLHRHFLYTSSGPSLAQYLLAHGAGGEMVEGAVRLTRANELPHKIRAGEVLELRIKSVSQAREELSTLFEQLRDQHLDAVTVGTLLEDSGRSV